MSQRTREGSGGLVTSPQSVVGPAESPHCRSRRRRGRVERSASARLRAMWRGVPAKVRAEIEVAKTKHPKPATQVASTTPANAQTSSVQRPNPRPTVTPRLAAR